MGAVTKESALCLTVESGFLDVIADNDDHPKRQVKRCSKLVMRAVMNMNRQYFRALTAKGAIKIWFSPKRFIKGSSKGDASSENRPHGKHLGMLLR